MALISHLYQKEIRWNVGIRELINKGEDINTDDQPIRYSEKAFLNVCMLLISLINNKKFIFTRVTITLYDTLYTFCDKNNHILLTILWIFLTFADSQQSMFLCNIRGLCIMKILSLQCSVLQQYLLSNVFQLILGILESDKLAYLYYDQG